MPKRFSLFENNPVWINNCTISIGNYPKNFSHFHVLRHFVVTISIFIFRTLCEYINWRWPENLSKHVFKAKKRFVVYFLKFLTSCSYQYPLRSVKNIIYFFHILDHATDQLSTQDKGGYPYSKRTSEPQSAITPCKSKTILLITHFHVLLLLFVLISIFWVTYYSTFFVNHWTEYESSVETCLVNLKNCSFSFKIDWHIK